MRQWPKITILFCLLLGVLAQQCSAQVLRLPRLRAVPHVSYSVPHVVFAQACSGPNCQPAAAPVFTTVALPSIVTQVSTPVTATAMAMSPEVTQAELSSGNNFSRAIVKAAVAAQRSGTISRVDLFRLRVAMLSPSFRQQAEELAIIQMAASGEETPFQYAEDGTIIRTAIDWEGLAAFLEKLLPLILTLLKAFGVG